MYQTIRKADEDCKRKMSGVYLPAIVRLRLTPRDKLGTGRRGGRVPARRNSHSQEMKSERFGINLAEIWVNRQTAPGKSGKT